MWAFVTGLASAALLALVTLFVLETATVTQVEQLDDLSVQIEQERHSE